MSDRQIALTDEQYAFLLELEIESVQRELNELRRERISDRVIDMANRGLVRATEIDCWIGRAMDDESVLNLLDVGSAAAV